MNRFLALILSLLLLMTACSGKAKDTEVYYGAEEIPSEIKEESKENDGEVKYYSIKTKEDLDAVRHDLNGHYTLENNISFTDPDFFSYGDYYNQGNGWLPIGTESEPFTGVFDGNGYFIMGLRIDMETAVYDENVYAGLFGVSEGEITDLGMKGCKIYVSVQSEDADMMVYAGTVAGNSKGSITNCYSDGTVQAELRGSAMKSVVYTGGIAGEADIISGSYNNAEVKSNGTVTTEPEDIPKDEYVNEDRLIAYAGGICGSSYGSITDCYNTGGISSVTDAVNIMEEAGDYANAGGIVGHTDGVHIYDCYNTGDIKVTSESAGCHAGGIIGHGDMGALFRCYNTGNIYGKVENTHRMDGVSLGGILGGASVQITDCYNSGKVMGTAIHDGENQLHTPFSHVGGIAGYGYINTSCYNVGAVELNGIYEHTSLGAISGMDNTTIACYYLDSSFTGEYDGNATGLTAEEMKKAQSYEGFDFENVWTIDPTAEYPYPTLK